MLNIVKKDKDGFSMTVQVKKVGNVTIKNILLKLRSHDTIKMIETGDTEVKHIQNHSYSAHGSFSMDWGKKFFPLYWDIFITVVDEEGNEERIKVTDATSKLKKQ
ncbi:MAG: hypothetical protein L0L86_06280, partial [Lactococcus lactis]|nr:hypothetical protein [Lactococcus lactis]